jgi:hypothetical protein
MPAAVIAAINGTGTDQWLRRIALGSSLAE